MSLWVLLLLLSFPPDNEVQCCFASQWLFYCVDKNSSYRFWAMRVGKPKGPFFLVELSIWANSPKSIDTRILCPCLLQSGILAESASKLNLLNLRIACGCSNIGVKLLNKSLLADLAWTPDEKGIQTGGCYMAFCLCWKLNCRPDIQTHLLWRTNTWKVFWNAQLNVNIFYYQWQSKQRLLK